tara:strand:- start:168 stop:383 length:216 start_codon:yes stop_codon:yes gene_type:complete
MTKLSEEEYYACIGFFDSRPNQVLKNGDKGYYIEGNSINLVTCCRNCGDYTNITITRTEADEILNFLLFKN